MGLHNLALTKCTTVDEVIALFKSYDFVTLDAGINLHWCVADANNNWRTLEYWKNEGDKQVTLNVLDEKERVNSQRLDCRNVAWEHLLMENYYYSCYGPRKEPASTWGFDYWQHEYGYATRVHNMMSHYSPEMDEKEALRVLQFGHYGIGFPGQTKTRKASHQWFVGQQILQQT